MNAKSQKFFNSRPIFYGFLTLLLAIASAKYIFSGNLSFIILVTVISICLTLFCVLKKKPFVLLSFIAVFMFGIGWFFVGISSFEGEVYEGTSQVYARISDDIARYDSMANVVLKDVKINGKNAGNIELNLYYQNSQQFQVGDIIEFQAEIENVHLFELGKFNSSYYRDRTPYTCSVDIEDVVVKGNRLTWDEKFRINVKMNLVQSMGNQNGAVAYAVLFGDKSDVGSEIKDSYKSAGIIHLLTVSGLHVSFLIALIGFLLKLCKVRGLWNFLVCATILFVYAYLCGFAPSILRAGVMGLVLLTAKLSGKCYDNLSSLGLAGIVILLIFPLSGLDIGFLMSFFCVLSIFISYDWISKLLSHILPKFISNSFAISISATLGILPFSATIYSKLNLLTFFVNLIVIPIFSVLYPFLFLMTLLCSILPFMSFLLKICSFGFDVIYKIASFFSKTNFLVDLIEINVILVAFLIVLMFFISKFFMANKKIKAIATSMLIAICLTSLGFTYIPTVSLSGICCCYNYSNSTVLLTDSAGKSIIVDLGSESFTKKLLNSQNVSNVETVFVLQDYSVDIKTLRNLGVLNLIRSDAGQGYCEEVLICYDEVGRLGNFAFVYKSYNGKLTGLEISFDSVKIFLFKNAKHSSEAIEIIKNENYDFVFVGKQTEIAKYFERNVKIYSYYKNDYADVNYKKSGNMCLEIENKRLNWRCLD